MGWDGMGWDDVINTAYSCQHNVVEETDGVVVSPPTHVRAQSTPPPSVIIEGTKKKNSVVERGGKGGQSCHYVPWLNVCQIGSSCDFICWKKPSKRVFCTVAPVMSS